MIATPSFAMTITPKLQKLTAVNKMQVKMKNAKNNRLVKGMITLIALQAGKQCLSRILIFQSK